MLLCSKLALKNSSEQVKSTLAAPTLHGSSLEYNYLSKEQSRLSNRQVPICGGRLLSGSSAVNYAHWTRCHSVDYDAWITWSFTLSSFLYLIAAPIILPQRLSKTQSWLERLPASLVGDE